MSKSLLRASEAAQEIGETVHILRNWLRDYRDFIPVTKSDAGHNLFSQESINVLLQIKRLSREQNYTTKQIAWVLAGGDGGTEAAAAAETDTAQDIAAIKEMMQRQFEFNQALLARLDKQQEYIEHALLERDKNLIQTLRTLQAAKQKKSWWQRLRGDN